MKKSRFAPSECKGCNSPRYADQAQTPLTVFSKVGFVMLALVSTCHAIFRRVNLILLLLNLAQLLYETVPCAHSSEKIFIFCDALTKNELQAKQQTCGTKTIYYPCNPELAARGSSSNPTSQLGTCSERANIKTRYDLSSPYETKQLFELRWHTIYGGTVRTGLEFQLPILLPRFQAPHR